MGQPEFQRQLCFNELSHTSLQAGCDVNHILKEYVGVINALKPLGFKGVRYEHGIQSLYKEGILDIYALGKNWDRDPEGRLLYETLISTSRHPYIDSTVPEATRKAMEENIHETAVGSEWKFGIGFSVAKHLDTVTISLPTSGEWVDGSYPVRVAGQTDPCGEVINVVSVGGVKSASLASFIESRTPVTLLECDLLPEKKGFHLRADHGTAELTELWERLRNSEYVVECINSLPFSRNKTYTFIDNIREDGLIEVRRMDCDPKYGIVIRTTGRTLRETEEIARLLNEKYG